MQFTRDGIVTVLLVIAALFLGTVVTERIPDPQETLNAPFDHEAGVGEPVAMRTGVVTVTGVRAAKQVTSFVDTATTRGVWLIVDTEWTPQHEPHILSGSEVRIRAADGRSFGGDSVLTASCTPTQPGITFLCSFAFEMDPKALPGATVLLPASLLGEADDVAVVDLGLDEAAAQRLAAATAPIKLPGPTVKAP